MRLMRQWLLFAVTIFCAGLTSVAGHAATYTATMSGHIVTTGLPGDFTIGQTASFVVQYDNGTTKFGNATFGLYPSSAIKWTMQMGSYSATATGGALEVWSNLGGFDAFNGFVSNDANDGFYFGSLSGPSVGGGAFQLTQASFSLTGPDGSAINDTALLTSAPLLEAFDSSFYLNLLFSDGNTSLAVSAWITDFSIAQTSEVPLPAALPLFATILAGGGVIAWRRKRKMATSCKNAWT